MANSNQSGSSTIKKAGTSPIGSGITTKPGIMTLTKFTVLRQPLVKGRTKKRPVVHLMGIPPMPNGYSKKSTTAITQVFPELPQV
ncbi:Uncharacterised protein [Moraxella bovis]|uniref:Uncharacterized protein n=1 Tax=Moraxella bovis TaxID=476 RepID=A0A378PT04_MORBO|nr:Uncharacterised protein [Moraxella bovis]